MSRTLATWRLAVRVGRRDVLRSKGRSALIMTMVGTPVLLTVMLTTLVASNELSPQERIADDMGSAAAVATYLGGTVMQSPDGADLGSMDEAGERLETPQQQARALQQAAGGEVQTVERGYAATVVVGRQGYRSTWLSIDASTPAATGTYRVESGRAPAAADEVMVSPKLARHGATIGSSVELDGGSRVTVVGIGRTSSVLRGGDPQSVMVMPGVLKDGETSFLIDGTGPVGWSEVQKLNRAGFVVTSREVLAHPPSEDAAGDTALMSSADDAATRAVLAVVVTSIVLEVVLLAGPAFAVGVRRQRRDLALLAAAGASPRQVRSVVLGQALVLGVLACALGAGLGTALSALVVRFGPEVVPRLAFGPFEMQRGFVAAAVLLGAAASMIAAYVPARQASKQEVAAVLAGRRGTVRSSRGWPLVGAVLVGVGLAACFTLGARQGGELAVAASTIAIVIGAVFVTPAVLGLVGRTGAALPLPLRLAVRDTARQRARSAPAIAAVMASVAGITTLSIGAASDFEQSRQDYEYQQPLGAMTISAGPSEMDRAVSAATAAAGGTSFVPIGSAGVESDDGNGTYIYPTTTGMYSGSNEAVVGDAAAAQAWGVRLTASQKAALASGEAIAGDRRAIKGGKVRLSVEGDDEKTRTVAVPAVLGDLGTGTVPSGPEPTLGLVLISPATMASVGLPWETRRAIADTGGKAVPHDAATRVGRAVTGVDPVHGSTYVERGFQESFTLPFVALLGFGVVAVLIGTMTATGLALSDARPDFSTLAAVGAAPRTRRLVAGAQAVVLATLGTVMGIAVGFAPGIAVTWPLTSESYAGGVATLGGPVIDVPWTLLGALVLLVPLIAALVAMVATRSRLSVVRRLAQ